MQDTIKESLRCYAKLLKLPTFSDLSEEKAKYKAGEEEFVLCLMKKNTMPDKKTTATPYKGHTLPYSEDVGGVRPPTGACETRICEAAG